MYSMRLLGQCFPQSHAIKLTGPQGKAGWHNLCTEVWKPQFDLILIDLQCSDEWADTQIEVDGTQGCLNSFSDIKKKYRRLRVVMSVGGGGQGSQTFAEVARSKSTRERFAESAKEFVLRYNLDGIDSESLWLLELFNLLLSTLSSRLGASVEFRAR